MKKIILMGVICGLMLSVSGCNTSDNKEKSVVNINEAKVKKINIKSEKNIALVDKNKKLPEESFKIIYQTDDAILGDLVVYVDASNNKIIAYGLRD